MKPIAVPGETYITEFENGYQDTAEEGVHCEGVATMLDGSIHDGTITHAVYVVTITPENFRRTGDHMFAVSSQEKLRCTSRGDGGAPGCVGSLRTYAEMLMGAEVRMLALFVKYELAETEWRKKSLEWESSCEFKIK